MITPRARVAAGFTLLEILVVVIIIGVIVSAATLSMGVLGQDSQVEEEAQRLWAVLQQAQEECELQGMSVGVYVGANAYEFLRFDARHNEWRTIEDDRFYRTRELPAGLRFRLWLEGREVVLKPRLPPRDDIEQSRKHAPQLMVLASGELMPFDLHIERDDAPALFRVVATPENTLRVDERNASGAEWRVQSDTAPPTKDERRT